MSGQRRCPGESSTCPTVGQVSDMRLSEMTGENYARWESTYLTEPGRDDEEVMQDDD